MARLRNEQPRWQIADGLTLKEKRKDELLWEHLPDYRIDSPGELVPFFSFC